MTLGYKTVDHIPSSRPTLSDYGSILHSTESPWANINAKLLPWGRQKLNTATGTGKNQTAHLAHQLTRATTRFPWFLSPSAFTLHLLLDPETIAGGLCISSCLHLPGQQRWNRNYLNFCHFLMHCTREKLSPSRWPCGPGFVEGQEQADVSVDIPCLTAPYQ